MKKKLGPAVIWRQKKTFFKRRKHQRRLNSREPLIMLQQSNIRHFRLNFWHSGSGLCGAMKMAKSWKEGMATKRRRLGLEGCTFKTRCQQGLFSVNIYPTCSDFCTQYQLMCKMYWWTVHSLCMWEMWHELNKYKIHLGGGNFWKNP